MALAKKVCRVCGKAYEACRSVKKDAGVFHWQEVACSPECGAEYLRRVNEARQVHGQEEAQAPDTVLLKEPRPRGKKKERKTVEPPAEELQADKEAQSDSEI